MIFTKDKFISAAESMGYTVREEPHEKQSCVRILKGDKVVISFCVNIIQRTETPSGAIDQIWRAICEFGYQHKFEEDNEKFDGKTMNQILEKAFGVAK